MDGPLSHHAGSLADTLTAVRLSLHVLGAAVWVGGQIVLAGLVPTVRKLAPEGPKAAARAFARLSWPAYGLVVATGLWNIAASHPSAQSGAWRVVLFVKVAVVALAGLAALAHSRATTRGGLALWGSVSGLTSLAALVMGVLLAG